MPRLTQVTDQNADPAAATLYGAIKQKIGMVPNLYRVMANEPAVLSSYLAFNDGMNDGAFDAQTREAIALTTAGANSCDYCASAHTAISKSLNIDDGEINDRLQARSKDPKVQAILKFASAVIDERGFVSSAEIQGARDAGLSEGEVVETVANVVGNIFTNYINHVAETEIDFPMVKSNASKAA